MSLPQLPDDAADKRLRDIVLAARFRGVIPYAEAKQAAEEMKITIGELMLLLVPWAASFAQPGISNFHVGAVAQGSTTGSLYLGANTEFPGQALSFTLHAEQAATANAWVNGEEGLTLLAVSAAPCGYCRQFLYEIATAQKLTVLLSNKPPEALTSLLPEAFGPKDLGVEAALMSPAAHGLVLDEPSSDPVVNAALATANASYAPYTGGYAGVAVVGASGETYTGRLAENAAYNPSLSPLEAAMAIFCIGEQAIAGALRIALVQADGAIADQGDATAAVVASLRQKGTVEFDVHGAHVAD
jgi:cytidine deaminase